MSVKHLWQGSGGDPRELAIPQLSLPRLEACHLAQEPEHGVWCAVLVNARFAEHHIAPAFPVDPRAPPGCRQHPPAEQGRLGQRFGMQLRIAAGQKDDICIAVRRLIGEGGEGMAEPVRDR